MGWIRQWRMGVEAGRVDGVGRRLQVMAWLCVVVLCVLAASLYASLLVVDVDCPGRSGSSLAWSSVSFAEQAVGHEFDQMAERLLDVDVLLSGRLIESDAVLLR